LESSCGAISDGTINLIQKPSVLSKHQWSYQDSNRLNKIQLISLKINEQLFRQPKEKNECQVENMSGSVTKSVDMVGTLKPSLHHVMRSNEPTPNIAYISKAPKRIDFYLAIFPFLLVRHVFLLFKSSLGGAGTFPV
jgi:hypothetical protein